MASHNELKKLFIAWKNGSFYLESEKPIIKFLYHSYQFTEDEFILVRFVEGMT